MPEPIIDVTRLVDELKERVARERAAGKYANGVADVNLEVLPPRPGADDLRRGFDLNGGSPHIRFRPELGFSSKPVIGYPITLVKKLLLRLLFFTLDDLAQQSDAAVQRLQNALAAEIAAREAAVSAEIAAREGLQATLGTDLGTLSQRIAGLAIPERLARLERDRRPAPRSQAVDASTGAPQTGAPQPVASAAGLDYLTFEERFRPQESVRERQQIYLELLRDRKRVVDLGCGRGELLAALQAEGISAYGVEIEPDFVALLEEAGIEVVEQDALEHLAGLDRGAVDGVVISHVVEHLPASRLVELISLAADKLAEGSVLIVETPNPESLLAGSVNFHRDPTHVRPIHPDTLAFLCESAGFSEIEIRRLSPVPPQHALPVPAEGELREVVTQLNDLLYGYQDYAVIARKAPAQRDATA
jgi:SAM-dependent methyltransferase